MKEKNRAKPIHYRYYHFVNTKKWAQFIITLLFNILYIEGTMSWFGSEAETLLPFKFSKEIKS